MKCPFCGYEESKVIDSRPADERSSIRRRRECLSCSKRFTTYETVESLPMVVVKKDGSRTGSFNILLSCTLDTPSLSYIRQIK